jgi:hypothetical protein
MIRVVSDYLKKGDSIILKRYSYFVLSKLIIPSIIKKASITIRVLMNDDLDGEVMDLKKYSGWVTYEGATAEGKKRFTIILNAKRLNRNAKKPMFRLKKIMLDLAHELVHVKQYLNNEMFDYADGKSRFRGEIFPEGKSDSDEVYFNSPWEIEAYGREQGMYKMFKKKYDNALKAKNTK